MILCSTTPSWVNVSERVHAEWENISFFYDLFPVLMNRISTDDLYEEFTDYQILHDNDITDEVWREAKVVDGLKRDVEDEDDLNHYRVDILWWHISKFAIPVTLVKRFKLLSKPADLVLVMPHGNADLKKLFSIVQKKTG